MEDEINVPDYLWSLERIDEAFTAVSGADEVVVGDYLWSNEIVTIQAAAMTSAIGRSLGIGRRVNLSFRGIAAVKHPFLCSVFEGLHHRFNSAWIWNHITVGDAEESIVAHLDTLRARMMSGTERGYRQAV